MKRIIFFTILISICAVSTKSYGQKLKYKIDFTGKYGFVDEKNKMVIPYKYEEALNFSEELAAVKLNNKWGFIDKTDNIVIPFKYDEAAAFYQGLALVKLNNRWIYIDKNDKEYTEEEAIQFKYTSTKQQNAQTVENTSVNASEKTESRDPIKQQVAQTNTAANNEAVTSNRNANIPVAATENSKKAPEVNIIDPLNGSVVEGEQVKISYIISETAPKSVKISIDGKSVQLITDAKIGQNIVTVDIPEKDCKISIVAQNEFGASAPAAVNLIRDDRIFKPSLYILAIGVSNYDNPDMRLQFPAKDATDFTQTLMRQVGQIYESVDVKLLTDRKATAENIRDGLEWLQTETTNRDIAMIFIAGHGVNNNVGDFYYMPVNADPKRINATCVSYMDIKATISAVAGKLLVFMDACHSGNVMGKQQQRAVAISDVVNELTSADSGPVVFTSSTGKQYSLEAQEWNNGAFTKALVEGLSGKADLSGKNQITVKSLDYYVSSRVKELTQGKQAPTTIIPNSIPDFPIAIVIDNN
jgi:hypothetical protein